MRTISLRLDDVSDALLGTLCERMDATQTDVIRKALEVLAKESAPSPAALARELGLVGLFASAGTDAAPTRVAADHSAAVKSQLVARHVAETRSAKPSATRSAKNDAKRSAKGSAKGSAKRSASTDSPRAKR